MGVGSEMVLANPLKLFIFAIYNTLSCQIFDIVITLVVDETHQSGKDKLLSRTTPIPSSNKTGMCNLSLFILRTYCKIVSTSLKRKLFCFTFDFDETFLDCSTHEYFNLTKFSQNWM